MGKLVDVLNLPADQPRRGSGSCNASSMMYRHDITSIRYTKQKNQERLQHHHNVLFRVSVSLPVVQAKDSFSLRQS